MTDPCMLTLFNVFKYHVSCTDGKISVRIKIAITLIFRFRRRPIQLVVFVTVGLSSFLRHLWQVLLYVEVFSVARLGQLTVTGRQKKFRHQRLAEDVRTTKGLEERTQLIKWNDGEA